MSKIDHITVTAPTLAIGAAFVMNALGVVPQPGGEHPRMGTHNLLLRLGDALFLDAGLTDQGLSLAKLEIFHPDPQRVSTLPTSLALSDVVECRPGDQPRLVAHINTSQGMKELSL